MAIRIVLKISYFPEIENNYHMLCETTCSSFRKAKIQFGVLVEICTFANEYTGCSECYFMLAWKTNMQQQMFSE